MASDKVHVLFVDDRKDRYLRFCEEYPNDVVDWAENPADAIYFLGKSVGTEGELYNEFRLDYHLLSTVTGNSVAHALACLAAYYKDTPVYCHSNTPSGAMKMQYTLLCKGFKDVVCECFDTKYPSKYATFKGATAFPKGMSKKWWKKHGKRWWEQGYSATPADSDYDWRLYREDQLAKGETKAIAKPEEESAGGSVSPIVM